MLENLFGSKARVKLLKLFLLHPQDKFYTREIARHLGLQLNSVHRELSNLEDMGLIISSQADGSESNEIEDEEDEQSAEVDNQKTVKAKVVKTKAKVKTASKSKEKKYYQVNTDFSFYKEIKALIIKAQILYEKDFTSKLKKIGTIKVMILTGLFINQLDSEIDLFLVGDFDKIKLAKLVKELEKDLVKEINYSVMTEDEFKYRREIADIFLYNILDSHKIVVIDESEVL